MHQYVSYIIYNILYRNEERIGQPTFDNDLNSSTHKTDRLYITEIVLKVALNTMTSLLSTVNQLTHLQYNTPSKDIWINCSSYYENKIFTWEAAENQIFDTLGMSEWHISIKVMLNISLL